MDRQRQDGVAGSYEPALAYAFLPRCEVCFSPHPRALKLDQDVCHECRAPVAKPGALIVVPAVVTGWSPSSIAARALFALGHFLRNLARKV